MLSREYMAWAAHSRLPPPGFPGPATIAREACSPREHGWQTPPAQAGLRAVAGLVVR